MEKVSAVVLSAGSGKRMGTKIAKQYLPIYEKPLIYYTLNAFEKSIVDEVVLVVASGEKEFCEKEIIEKYKINKVVSVVEGGKERYDSVYHGLQTVAGEYVLIHDGARAFVTPELINMCVEHVRKEKACVVAVPVKDTIKVSDENGYAKETLERAKLWSVQTPQCFETQLVLEAYTKIMQQEHSNVTDDAMVVETMTKQPVKLIMGDYNNIKVTTPEDLLLGEAILKKYC